MASNANQSTITLPAGWSVGPGKETSRQNPAGGVSQGLSFTLAGPDGTNTSFFVPYAQLTNTQAVQDAMTARIAAITAITSAQSN